MFRRSQDEFRDPDALMLDLGLSAPARRLDLAWPDTSDVLVGDEVRLPLGRLTGFSTALFVQAYANEAQLAARLIDYTRVGVVFTLDHRRSSLSPFQRARAAIEFTRRDCGTQDILVDFSAYSGPGRKYATDGLSQRWVRDQLEHLRLPWAMTDSGFCRDLRDVDRTLNEAERFGGNVIVALPMRHQLMRDHASDLVDRINAQPHPVAVMLEHERDPLDVAGVVAGLAEVISESRSGALLLRSDTSAVGAVSHGAVVGAVGTRGGLRHIYPASDGGGRPEELAFVIPALLGYYRQVRFEQAYLVAPELATWACACWFCARRPLTWIGNQPDHLKYRAAFQHSVTALAMLGAQLTAHGSPAAAWSEICRRAEAQHTLLCNPSGSTWSPKPALAHWRAVTGTPAAR